MNVSNFKLSEDFRNRLHRALSGKIPGKFVARLENLGEVLEYTVKTFPDYKPVLIDGSVDYSSGTPPFVDVTRVRFYHRGVAVGDIQHGWMRGRYAVIIQPSSSSEPSVSSLDLTKLKRMVRTKFVPVLDARLMSAKSVKAGRLIASESNKLHQPVWKARMKLNDAMVQFATAHLEQFAKEHPSNDTGDLIAALKAERESIFIHEMNEAFDKGHMVTAVENTDGSWVVCPCQAPMAHKTYADWDALPEYLQARVGMLRMRGDNGLMEGVGAKNDDTYVVYSDTTYLKVEV